MSEHRTVGNNPALASTLPALWHDVISHAHFSSPEALCAFVESKPESSYWEDTAIGDDRKFTGTSSLQQALKLCRDGWPEGAARVAKLRDKIIASNPIAPRLSRWDVAGAYPSVARALSGNPMNMRRIDSAVTRRRPVLTIVHHMGGSSFIEADTFCNKAAVMAAIIDAIEGAGYSVELIAVSVSAATKNREPGNAFVHETAITVKEAGQSVDIGKLAFAVGHVAMFRRFAFACRTCDDFNKPLGGTLGHTVDYHEIPEGRFILPSLMKCEKHFETEATAATRGLNFFISELQKQGCPAFPSELETIGAWLSY